MTKLLERVMEILTVKMELSNFETQVVNIDSGNNYVPEEAEMMKMTTETQILKFSIVMFSGILQN